MPLDELRKHEKQIDAIHGIKFTALENALNSYYSSLYNLVGGVGLAFFALPGEETEFDNDNHLIGDYPSCFINSIVGLHHFFELYIKDVLSEYNSLLSQRITNFSNPNEILNQLNGGNIQTSSETVNFKFALKILKQLKVNQNNPTSEYKLFTKHDFLLQENNYQTILRVHDYRNSTLHKANIILGYIAFDFFISQHVLPLVYEILKTEPEYHLCDINKKVACRINILEEILKIKFDISDLIKSDFNDKFSDKICYLAHLKELGRASHYRPIDLPLKELKKELDKKENNDEFIMDGYNRSASLGLKQYKLAEKLAISESKNSRVHQRLICPCCGAKTLLTYWEMEVPAEGLPVAFRSVNSAACNFCSYTVSRSMSDPNDFKITPKPIFHEFEDGWPFDSFNPSRKELDDYE